MSKTLQIIIGIVIIAVIVILVFVFDTEKPIEGVVTIGVLAPLTGEANQWGIPPKEGVELALEIQWGIPPKEGVELALEIIKNRVDNKRVEVIYEDTQCDPVKGVNAVQKLINVDKVNAIIGAVCSSVTLAIAPIVEKNEVPLISPASTNPKISEAGEYIFRVVPSDALRGQIFADYIKNDAGVNKVAILYINNEGGAGNKDFFKKRFEELGGKIVTIESYAQGTKDVKTQLMKIKNQNIQAIVIVSYPADSVIILKQTKELGLSLPLYFQTEALEDPSVLEAAGESANGVIYILQADPLGKEVEEFEDMFKEKFNRAPVLYAAEGFDAFNLIIEAIKKCKTKTDLSSCIKDELYTIKNYQGASGTTTFDEKGDVLKPMAIKIIENGKKKVLMTK